jgi:predicted HTH transcriptional regulator
MFKDDLSMYWKEKSIKSLHSSLHPVPTELNELDWKSGLPPKTDRLAQHISAFANLTGGGTPVFGVDNEGNAKSISKIETDQIVQKLGNIALIIYLSP